MAEADWMVERIADLERVGERIQSMYLLEQVC